MDQKELVKIAIDIINNNIYLTLATTGGLKVGLPRYIFARTINTIFILFLRPTAATHAN